MKIKSLTAAAIALLLAATACEIGTIDVSVGEDDASLEGVKVDLSALSVPAKKLFVLNEGGMGSNNASLDFLRFSDGTYVTGAFRQMNPYVAGGLGDVANAIAVNGDEVWIAVNNSGIVEVIDANNEKEIASIAVPTPRAICFDDNYAYVTSWAGAYISYGADYSVSDAYNPKGCVYRIGLKTKKIEGSVEVGYQPEGIGYSGGLLYVANSGGLASQLPPDYSYDYTVSVIDATSFIVKASVPVTVNLKDVLVDSEGNVSVTSLGNYYDQHSGLYTLQDSGDGFSAVGTAYVTCAAVCGDTVYWLGTEDEYNWGANITYSLRSCNTADHQHIITNLPLTVGGTPYGMAILPAQNGDARWIVIADAGDYFNPGSVKCYSLSDATLLWRVDAGVCPGHFALW